jgi:hypothetical protein
MFLIDELLIFGLLGSIKDSPGSGLTLIHMYV